MQRRGVERVIAKALQTLPVGFRVARQNASFTNLGHEPDHWRCPQFGRYRGESGHDADGPIRSRMTQRGDRRWISGCKCCVVSLGQPRLMAGADIELTRMTDDIYGRQVGLARMVSRLAALETARPSYETEADNDDRLGRPQNRPRSEWCQRSRSLGQAQLSNHETYFRGDAS